MNQQTVDIKLPTLHTAQKHVFSEAKRFNVLNCGRRWGKSVLASRLLIKTAFAKYPCAYFAPTYKLLEGTFNEIMKIVEPMIFKKHDQQFIQLVGGGTIDFWSMENQLAGRSRKYKLAIVDEAAFNRNLWSTWTEAIRPTLTDMKGDAWFMSTPKGKNDFYKLWMRGQTHEPNWMSWQMPTSTNPFIDLSEIEDAQRDLPELAFSQEYLAQFNESVANPFGFNFIKMCTMPQSTEPAVCYGIDLAKSVDWTVIIGLDRFGQVCSFDRFQRPWNETKEIILRLPKAPLRIDSTGVGDPIVEDVQRTREQVTGVKYTSQTKQQLMEGLAAAIQQRKITFPPGVIASELESFEFEMTRTGVKYTAPPGMHDDCVNALALAWAEWQVNGGKQFKYVFV